MRIFKAAFVTGALASSLAAFLYTLGVFTPWTRVVFGIDPALTFAPLWPQWTAGILLGFGLAWTTLDICSLTLKTVVAAIALLETAGISWLLAWRGVIWPPFTALSAGLFAYLLGLGYSLSPTGRHRRYLEEILGGRISPDTFERLLASSAAFPSKGGERQASVVVCRFVNRRELAETLPAEDFVTLSNGFFSTVSHALKRAGGVLVEADGEHIHAVFGALLGDAEHPARACRAALALQPSLDALCREAHETWGVNPDCRIAVETGPVIAGVFGAPDGGVFGVVGEALDAARRLCRANLFYGTRLLIGARTYLAARAAIEARPVDLVWNRDAREEIYEPLGEAGQLSPEALQRRDAYWVGLIHFRARRWDDAAAMLFVLLHDDTGAEDPLVRFYLGRIEPKPGT